MEKLLEKTILEIIEKVSASNTDWDSGHYSIIATPAVNAGFTFSQEFNGKGGNRLEFDRFVLDCWMDFVKVFEQLNKEERINKITFRFSNKRFVDTINSWDQSVQDEFDLYLPKSKKGKIKPWFSS